MRLRTDTPSRDMAIGGVSACLIGWAVTGWIVGDYLSAALSVGVAVVIFGLLYRRLAAFDSREEVVAWLNDLRRPTGMEVFYAGIVLLSSLGARLLAGTIHSLIATGQAPATHAAVSEPSPTTQQLVGLFLLAALIGPILEEFMFRNGLQKLLAAFVRPSVAIIATSIVFATLHVPQYGGFGAPLGALAVPVTVVFVDSCLFGTLYWRTGTIVAPMLAHGSVNAVALLTYAT